MTETDASRGSIVDSFEVARLAIAREPSGQVSLQHAFEHATRISAQTLEVARVGVWLFDEGRHRFRCAMLYERATDTFSQGDTLDAESHPEYFAAIGRRRVVAVEDARTHRYTHELTEKYLDPRSITSMMDASLYREGEVVGIVCHEHVGPQRRWTDAEVAFCSAVADMLGTSMEHAHLLAVEQNLRETEGRLHRAERLEALERMAAELAHDLNNVLSVIQYAVAHARDEETRGKPVASLLGEIDEGVASATKLALQLLDFAGKQRSHPERFQVSEWLTRVEPSVARIVGQRVQVQRQLDATGFVQIDPILLERVLVNLATNARDAMPDGGHLTLRDYDEPERIVIEISDDGSGMDEVTRLRVFEPYFTTKGARGNGLGLASVHGIVRSLGGSIEVVSALGEGSTFRICLPRAN